jgi:hypothetical protein
MTDILGQELHPAASNVPLAGKQVRLRGKASARFKICHGAQGHLPCLGELGLRPIEEPARGAGGRSTDN